MNAELQLDNGYRLITLYRQMNATLAEGIAGLWHSQGALPAGVTAEQRLPQVILAARNGAGEVVGVNSGELVMGRPGMFPGKRLCNFRQLIRPQDRSFGLSIPMSREARRIIRESGDFDGMLFVPQNPKYQRPGYQKRFYRLGFKPLAGTQAWYLLYE